MTTCLMKPLQLATIATIAGSKQKFQEVGKLLTPHHPLMLGQKPFLLDRVVKTKKQMN